MTCWFPCVYPQCTLFKIPFSGVCDDPGTDRSALLVFGTELGCSIRATGGNDRMARAQGINTDFNRVLGLMVSNGLVALSGALLSQYQGFADINMGAEPLSSDWPL